MSNNNQKDWIHADSYIPADEYRERLKLWSMGWKRVLIQGSTPFQLYTDDNDLIPNKTKKIPTVRTDYVESFISTMSPVNKTYLRAILSCPDRPTEPYSSDDEMLIDQLLRNLGIFDYCSSKDCQVDTELEEAKNRWPIGTKYRLKDVKSYPDVYTVKKVSRSQHGFIFIDDSWHETSIEKVDTELEDAKKKFPVGSWFFHNSHPDILRKVYKVERSKGYHNRIVVRSNKAWTFIATCTPFTFPTVFQWKSVNEPPVAIRNVLLKNGSVYLTAYYHRERGWFIWTGTMWTSDFQMRNGAQWTEEPK